MKFTLYDHAGKGLYLRQQLLTAGHELAETADEMELLLLDCDWPWAYPRPELIQSAYNRGAPIVLYPHGGRPTCWVYDGIASPDDRVDLRLEHGPGSVRIAVELHQDWRQEAPGWLYCPTRDFTPVENPTRVLFAPLHPNIEMMIKGTDGTDPAPLMNQRIYQQLLAMPDIELVVSLAGPSWRTGVWPHPKTRFADNPNMLFHHSFEQILSVDVVVAAGTIGAAAVALGKPTVMFDQDLFADYVNDEYVQAGHSGLYRDLARYPLDASDGNLPDLIATACQEEQTGWRDLWVGTDGTENAILLLEDLVEPRQDVVIQGATAAAIVRS